MPYGMRLRPSDSIHRCAITIFFDYVSSSLRLCHSHLYPRSTAVRLHSAFDGLGCRIRLFQHRAERHQSHHAAQKHSDAATGHQQQRHRANHRAQIERDSEKTICLDYTVCYRLHCHHIVIDCSSAIQLLYSAGLYI